MGSPDVCWATYTFPATGGRRAEAQGDCRGDIFVKRGAAGGDRAPATRLFDTSDSTIADAVVLLQGSRITAKGLTLAIPTGAQNRRDARIGEAERSSRF